jgi:lipopolysaccharide export system protein LptA
MRRAGWLILAAIIVIVFGVGATYYVRLAELAKTAVPAAKAPQEGVDVAAQKWHLRKTEGPCPISDIEADNMQSKKDPSTVELTGVTLKLYHNCGKSMDQVESAKAQFDSANDTLYADGQVTINMDIPKDGVPTGHIVKIVTSGVHFETRSGKVTTDRAAAFTFDQGNGNAVGADYDPGSHQLHLKSQVALNFRSPHGDRPPMIVETDDLVYFETQGQVSMSPWARLTRDTLKIDGGHAVVKLNKNIIREVDTENAHGTDVSAGKNLQFAAGYMQMDLTDQGQVNKISGRTNAQIVSTAASGKTQADADNINLVFAPSGKQSPLQQVLAWGHAVVESTPASQPGTKPDDTRILKADSIEMHMRPGGRDIGNVQTDSPASLEFVPNSPGEPHRYLNGSRLWVAYGPKNNIESVRSTDVTTRTVNPSTKAGHPNPPVITSSKELTAHFDPKTEELDQLEQKTDFHYQAGARRAQADLATLDQGSNVMTLIGRARVWDPTGSATADKIVINQESGDFEADGHVSSTHMPDQSGSSSSMLSTQEPLEATADRMTSTDDNLNIRYDGHAVAWQGANRLQADHLDIDRDNQVLKATGHVVSQFIDKPKKGRDGKPLPNSDRQTVFTIVKADRLTYTEDDRVALYTGNVTLNRPNMKVTAHQIKAFLNDSSSDSSLDRAFADGNVVIVQNSPNRTRTGTAQHAEYYTADQKVILVEGHPQMAEAANGVPKGVVKGTKLTYYANDDRLVADGTKNHRVVTTIHHLK